MFISHLVFDTHHLLYVCNPFLVLESINFRGWRADVHKAVIMTAVSAPVLQPRRGHRGGVFLTQSVLPCWGATMITSYQATKRADSRTES
jgi:hypothetical protein